MKTIKDLVNLNDAHSIQILTTTDYDPNIRSRSIYDVLKSFKHLIKIISDTKDIVIYTKKDVINIDIEQVMDIPISIDNRYNIFVTQDV